MKFVIKSRKDLKFCLHEDMKQMGGGGIMKLSILGRWLLGEENPRMRLYIWVLRHLEYYTNVNVPIIGLPLRFLFEIWNRRQSFKYGVYIHKNTCGYGLRIVHIGGIHINAISVGNYCSFTQGVVLGKKKGSENRPCVGDNVHFTLGCKVIGRVTIGDNSVICPNSVVIKDVPENSIVSGVPATIVKQRNRED